MVNYTKRDMKEGKCSVCGFPVRVDEIGNGDICQKCGWEQDSMSNQFPHHPGPIVISLEKARLLYKEGKPLKPDFEDFIYFYETYGEVEFTYDNVIYGMSGNGKEEVLFWSCALPVKQRAPMVFASIDEFVEKASIDGILVKDLWYRVENPGCLK